MSNQIVTIDPQWGINYKPGYVGFTFHSGSFISEGIGYFTRWDRTSRIPVSHALIVSGENECIEAQGSGVVVSDLQKYFKDLKYTIAFKKPVGWTPELGEKIVASARERVGMKYGYSLIVGSAITHSVFGKLLDRITRGWSTRTVTRAFDSKKQEICSELVAHALWDQPEYEHVPLLQRQASEITPQMLFEDTQLFEEWKTSEAAIST